MEISRFICDINNVDPTVSSLDIIQNVFFDGFKSNTINIRSCHGNGLKNEICHHLRNHNHPFLI